MRKIILILPLLAALLLPVGQLSAQTLTDDSPQLLYSDFYDRALSLEPLGMEDPLSPYVSHLWMASLADKDRPSLLMSVASLLIRYGDNERAQQLLMRAYESSDGDHLIGESLARLALLNGDLRTAETVIGKLLEANPDDRFLLVMLREAYKRARQADRAIEVTKKLVELSHEDPREVAELALLYTASGQAEQAKELLEEFVGHHPGEVITGAALLMIYLESEEYDKVEPLLAKLRQQKLLDEERFNLAMIETDYLIRRKAYDRFAERILEEATKEGADPSYLETLIQEAYSMAQKSAADAELRRALLPTRLRLVELFPETPQMPLSLSQDYLLLGDTIAAERVMEQMVEERTELATPYVYFAQRYAAVEDTVQLRRYAIAGHEALPEEGIFRLYLALLSINGGDSIGFSRQLDEALTAVSPDDPFYPQLALLKADELASQEHFDEARPYYDAAVSQPNPIAYNNYAYFLSEKSDRPEDLNRAEELARLAIKLEPDNGTYLDTYAWILYKKDSPRLALVYMRQAIDAMAEEEDVTLYLHLAEILTDLGEYDEAVRAWRKYLELGGDPEAMEPFLDKLPTLKDKPDDSEL